MHHNSTAADSCFRMARHTFPPMDGRQPAHPFGATCPANYSLPFSLLFHVLYAAGFIRKSLKKFFSSHCLEFEGKFQISKPNLFTLYKKTDKHNKTIMLYIQSGLMNSFSYSCQNHGAHSSSIRNPNSCLNQQKAQLHDRF
jgi:hypothetical protein